jgi:uncharacterized protein (TIGR02217 family)
MIDFLEAPRFPDNIGFHSTSSTEFKTDVVVLNNGFEQRNAKWSHPLHRYDVASGIKNEADLSAILHFFNSVRGRLIGFRFKDWLDYSSASMLGKPIAATDQLIGVGDGSLREFSLTKTYQAGVLSHVRRIHKPVESTVMLAVNGKVESRFTVNTVTGVVALPEDDDPPCSGDLITAGFEFDVPCRFDTDQLAIGLSFQNLGNFTVPCIEIRC